MAVVDAARFALGKATRWSLGYSHSGWGLQLPDYLPNGQRGLFPETNGGAPKETTVEPQIVCPTWPCRPSTGIGANEYIVAAAHDVCDFIITVDTPAVGNSTSGITF